MAQPAPRGIMRIFCSGPGYEPRQREFISNAKGASIGACYRWRMGSRSWHAKGEAERPPAYGFLPATRLPEQPCPSSSCSSARNEAGVPYGRHDVKYRRSDPKRWTRSSRVSLRCLEWQKPRSWKRSRRGESVGCACHARRSARYHRLDCGSGAVRYEKCLICNHFMVGYIPSIFFLI